MVRSLGNSSNNFIGSYLNFYKININIDCGPIPFKGRSYIEKISLIAYAGENVNRSVCQGKIFFQGLRKKFFYSNQITHTPSPLKVKWLTLRGLS